MVESIYVNLLKNNHNRELYLKLELINSTEPEWINPDGKIRIGLTKTIDPNIIGMTLVDFNKVDGAKSYGIAIGNYIRAYPIENNFEINPFNQYSFPIIYLGLGIDDPSIALYADITNSGYTQNDFPDSVLVDRFYFIEKEIFGKVISGGINIDSQNTNRRTLNVSFSVDLLNENSDIRINDFLNKRIKVYIGMKNLFNETLYEIENNGLPPDNNNIVWFKMGVFNLTDINMEHSLDSISINITAQDKSILIDGNGSGTFGEAPPTQYYDQDTAVGYYDLITDFLINYGDQQSNKTNINFSTEPYSNFYISIPSYNSGTTAGFLLQYYNNFERTTDSSQLDGGLTFPTNFKVYSNFYWATTTAYTTSSGITLYYPVGLTIAPIMALTISGYTSIFSSATISSNIWRDFKPIEFLLNDSSQPYYKDAPLEFNANDNVLGAISNTIQKFPGNYQFYFDENGDFNLKQNPLTEDILSYVNPFNLNPNAYKYTSSIKDNSFSSFFADSVVINSFSHQTRYASLKNDLSVYDPTSGLAYSYGISTPYDSLGTTSYTKINGEVLYHAIVTALPKDIRTYGFTSGYGNIGLTYGHPYQQFIIDKTNKDPITNINSGLNILKNYKPELSARFEFIPIPGITEWSMGFSTLSSGNTVYIGKTNNYYSLTSAFTTTDWINPINNYPINTAGTYKGAKFLGTYNPYYGIYRKLNSNDLGVIPITYNTDTFYYTTTNIYNTNGTFHFGIYRSSNTGNPNIDFDIKKPLGDYTTWLYWFDVLDEKINFWDSGIGYSTGSYVLYNDKTYRAINNIDPDPTLPTVSSNWMVARQGYGLYDLSIENQGLKKIRLENTGVNVNFKKNIDIFTNIPQIYLVGDNIAYDLNTFNTRLNYLVEKFRTQGVTTAYLILNNSGVNNAGNTINKFLPSKYTELFDSFTQMKDLMFKYMTLEDNISISTLPIYPFDVDTKINIKDSQLNIDSDYYIRSVSIPLDNTGLMNLEGIKITPLFSGSGLNNPHTIEIASFTTTNNPGTTITRYFINDTTNNTLNIYNNTTTGIETIFPLSLSDVVETAFYKNTDGLNYLFLLDSNLLLSVYDYDAKSLTNFNLGSYLSTILYKSLDFIRISNTEMHILCISQTSLDHKVIIMNPDNLTINTADTRTISKNDLPISLGNLASITYDGTYFYVYAYKNDPKVYVFKDNSINKTYDLIYSNSLNNTAPNSKSITSNNSAKIRYFGATTTKNPFYVLTDNNIFRFGNINNSFSGLTVSFSSLDFYGDGVINSVDQEIARDYYSSIPGSTNNFTNLFTSTLITQIGLQNVYGPTSGSYPRGTTIVYDFSANSFGGYQITSTSVVGYSVGRLTELTASGPTVGLLSRGGTPISYYQSVVSSGITVAGPQNEYGMDFAPYYTQLIRDNLILTGLFNGVEDIFIHPTDGIYIVAGTNIFLLSDYFLTNSSASLIFT